VVVRDFDFVGMIIHPSKADAILVVDPDAELSYAVTPETLEAVPRWNAQLSWVPISPLGVAWRSGPECPGV
jgi:hypothetical protein